MMEKLQSFADGKYDLERRDIEQIYEEQQGNTAEQLDALSITNRIVSTGMSAYPHVTLLIKSQDASAVAHCFWWLSHRTFR